MSSTRSGGRSAIVRARVLAAASDLVTTKGPQNVTIPEIAQRAGVAASSLYRRWGDVGALLLEMAAERLAQKFPLPDEGSIEGDLRCWTEKIVLGLNSTEEPIFFRILLAAGDVAPEKRIKALAPRREQLQAMLERGRARGERTPTVEDLVDHLLAPLYMRALVGLPVNEALAKHLVERLLNTPP
ncbi:TetR family transcriptional regulator [Reticulibacter mediterranei]|uniref:TetR family transcriptional regulator n=1 Tax=Reticulibacter mediterranei TaxID=2778369 RepID=A0A8J3IYB3_9CHLR|nr:TetR/AcrR family transcriptional regulator [Reticulibacter mediterranei]GHO98997.1 TetR family transcriptional regulator [Reticulibacter mediterranei]